MSDLRKHTARWLLALWCSIPLASVAIALVYIPMWGFLHFGAFLSLLAALAIYDVGCIVPVSFLPIKARQLLSRGQPRATILAACLLAMAIVASTILTNLLGTFFLNGFYLSWRLQFATAAAAHMLILALTYVRLTPDVAPTT